MLAHFPENYRLYEHVRFTASSEGSETAKEKDKKSHAKGPNDRQDAYLYGHPEGRKKRFRSPADFFPHALWLVLDDTSDPDNCSCKICAPDDIQCPDLFPELLKEANKQPLKEVVTSMSPIKAEKSPMVPMVVVPKQQAPQAKQVKPIPQANKSAASPVTAGSARNSTAMLVPTPLASSKSAEQEQDAQYGKFVFRPGEIVWFHKGGAWGLSVIINRSMLRDSNGREHPHYLVQPLSHPFEHQPPQIKIETDLRPWLAWSAPPAYHPGLHQNGMNYSNIDWKGVLEGRFGEGDAEVDGSIFAAKAIDESYILVQSLSNSNSLVTTGERLYNGIYYGGEKFWVGEPIRLRTSQGQDIMVVHRIVERLKPNSTSTSSATVHLIGDLYRFTIMPYNPTNPQPSTEHLPLRMRREFEFYNRIIQPLKQQTAAWKLTQVQLRTPITDVKGRWYEASTLLPILQSPQEFQYNIRNGDIKDTGVLMNGRGDASHLPVGQAGKRYLTREEAFGEAIPKGTKINKGMDGPEAERGFPVENVGMEEVKQAAQPLVDDMAQFMNLEGMGDSMTEGPYGAQVWGEGQP